MGIPLFDTDISGAIRDAMADGLPKATLRRPSTPAVNPADPTATQTISYRNFPCRAFEDDSTETRDRASAVQRTGRLVLIIGDTLPKGIFPRSGDRISLLGESLEIIGEGVSSDPARATYLCACRG